MSGRRASFLTARREVRERLRSRAFRISTLIQVLAVVAVAVAVSVTGKGSDTTEVDLGRIGGESAAVTADAKRFGEVLDVEFKVRDFDDPEAARAALRDGDIEAAVGDGRTLLVTDGLPDQAEAALAEAASRAETLRQLDREGIPADRAAEILGSSQAPVETVETDKDDDGSQGIAFITTLLLYLALIFCGYAVAGGVVEEKATRVVELVINAIQPRHLLAGKVVGIGLMGLLQLLLVVVAGLGVALAMGKIDLPEATFETAGLALLFFILGFALYGCAFAVAGSIVSRQEDSTATTTPVMIVLVGAYFLSITASNEPTSTLAVAGTLIPPLAPLIVPARAASGELPADQLILSIILMLAACALLIWIAGKVYERAVLKMGAPVKARELLRLMRS
jgi:ABC-2 type transport system permease protein